MSDDAAVTRMVEKEFRRRGLRRFLLRAGLALGIVLGGFAGAAVPTRATYVDALDRRARSEDDAATAILATYTSVLAYLEGGREAAFLRDGKVDPAIKQLYREHRHRAEACSAEARTLSDGVQSLVVSLLTHPRLALRAGLEGLGKPDLFDAQVYKQAGGGALAGGLAGLALAALATRRRRTAGGGRQK